MQICGHLTFPELKELLVTSLPSFGPCRVKSPTRALQRLVGLSNLPGAMLRSYSTRTRSFCLMYASDYRQAEKFAVLAST